jgi:hypothetical protein
MYYLDEPLVHEASARRRERLVLIGQTLAGCALVGALGLALRAGYSPPSPLAGTTALFGPSAGCSVDGPKFSIDKLRQLAKIFVDSLGDDITNQTYYPDASRQVPQWQICTIVQQCLVPKYGLPVARLYPRSRTKFYDILALVLSDESYKRIMVQQLSNLLLGEMQTWATECPGQCVEARDARSNALCTPVAHVCCARCRALPMALCQRAAARPAAQMDDPSGLLPDILHHTTDLATHPVDVDYGTCADMAEAGRHTLWNCNVPPVMIHHGNMDTDTGQYQLGNVRARARACKGAQSPPSPRRSVNSVGCAPRAARPFVCHRSSRSRASTRATTISTSWLCTAHSRQVSLSASATRATILT